MLSSEYYKHTRSTMLLSPRTITRTSAGRWSRCGRFSHAAVPGPWCPGRSSVISKLAESPRCRGGRFFSMWHGGMEPFGNPGDLGPRIRDYGHFLSSSSLESLGFARFIPSLPPTPSSQELSPRSMCCRCRCVVTSRPRATFRFEITLRSPSPMSHVTITITTRRSSPYRMTTDKNREPLGGGRGAAK